MKHDGFLLQRALFEAIENNSGLLSQFTMFAGGQTTAQFSYDGMRSSWRDRPSGLVEHRIGFSVWAQQAGFGDADALADKIGDCLETLVLQPPLVLVQLRLVLVDGGMDGASRSWRQQLSYEITTQNEHGMEAS